VGQALGLRQHTSQAALGVVELAQVRHGSFEFRDFCLRRTGKARVCNRGFPKAYVVQTYPLEASGG